MTTRIKVSNLHEDLAQSMAGLRMNSAKVTRS
ncbi:MAG: hypothetical protein ACI9R7_002242, partial [Lysobacterales bacterium]